MTPEEVIEHYGKGGGAEVAAKALGVSPQAISQWRRSGVVPIGRQCRIQIESGGLLVADSEKQSLEPQEVAVA